MSRRIIAARPSRKGGMTDAQRRQLEKSSFIANTRAQFDELITSYFLSRGYFVLATDVDKVDEAMVTAIERNVRSFQHAQRLVQDGGPLTGKRRETMLEAIYALESMVDAIAPPHPLLSLYSDFRAANRWASRLVAAGIVFAMVGFFSFSSLFASATALSIAALFLMRAFSIRTDIRSKAIDLVSLI